MKTEWPGDNPYYLTISQTGGRIELIDLDERGWATKFAHLMRVESIWMLCPKSRLVAENRQVGALALIVHDGEQPYYTARHIGAIGSGGSNEVIAYGIGKKLRDGSVQRLWLLAGTVWSGDDVEEAAMGFLRTLGPRKE